MSNALKTIKDENVLAELKRSGYNLDSPQEKNSGNRQDRITPGKRKNLMSTQHKMRLPFATKKEILDWEAFYFEGLSEMYQRLEPAVIVIKKT